VNQGLIQQMLKTGGGVNNDSVAGLNATISYREHADPPVRAARRNRKRGVVSLFRPGLIRNWPNFRS
jgi:hypothetical protein